MGVSFLLMLCRVSLAAKHRRRQPRLEPLATGAEKPSSDGANLLGLRALLALRDLELDALVLVEAAESAGGDRRVVDENVRAAAVLGDETEALLGVEPLHGALSHLALLLSVHPTAVAARVRSRRAVAFDQKIRRTRDARCQTSRRQETSVKHNCNRAPEYAGATKRVKPPSGHPVAASACDPSRR